MKSMDKKKEVRFTVNSRTLAKTIGLENLSGDKPLSTRIRQRFSERFDCGINAKTGEFHCSEEAFTVILLTIGSDGIKRVVSFKEWARKNG
jgi:hypothetical protein